MGTKSTKMTDNSIDNCISDSFSVYVPLESLTEATVHSIISVAGNGPNEFNSEYALLMFLLAINKKLEEIENSSGENEKQFDEHMIEHAKKVRQWLVDNKNKPLNWNALKQEYDRNGNRLADYSEYDNAKPYSELTRRTSFEDVKQSREYMKRFRDNGYKPEELKLYWNAEQLENLCPKQGEQSETEAPPHDPSDDDCIKNLRQYPVSERNHNGTINYINKGIEKAVFDIPDDAQIIVLNFANEQSPGGGYLRHALAQEEVILYNSDGYRALLDLQYKRMGGGYAIPEFGLAYVRDICFFDSKSEEKYRKTDMLVSACYCLDFAQLYPNPRNKEERTKNYLAKFRAFMSAAVANTIGDGSNTYLLLGPIGTGAFGNDVTEIGEVFRDVLQMPMMNSKGPIRYAFGNIWFVSTEKWKNDVFEEILSGNEPDNKQEN